jgi:hypothetical protein
VRRARLAAIVAVAGLAACAQEPPRADPPSVAAQSLAGFGWFAELAGSCWSGTRSDRVTLDTQCYLPQYQRLMRGSFKAEVAGNVVFEGDAVFALDPEGSGKVVYTQWGTDGGYATGEMKVDGDTLVFHSRNVDGSEWLVRHVWRRTGPDGYRVTRERKEDAKWVEAFTVEYKRIPGR